MNQAEKISSSDFAVADNGQVTEQFAQHKVLKNT